MLSLLLLLLSSTSWLRGRGVPLLRGSERLRGAEKATSILAKGSALAPHERYDRRLEDSEGQSGMLGDDVFVNLWIYNLNKREDIEGQQVVSKCAILRVDSANSLCVHVFSYICCHALIKDAGKVQWGHHIPFTSVIHVLPGLNKFTERTYFMLCYSFWPRQLTLAPF